METTPTPAFVSVSELNRTVKRTIDSNRELRSVWVVGELSNVRKNNSPHLFPRLKDEGSELGLVIWANVVEEFGPLIKDGAKVLAHGSVRAYEARGTYQLYVDEIREFGVGDLFARFEALKKRLKEEGLFEQKRSLPAFPKIVGVVTSIRGAVIQDILRNLMTRYPPIRVIIAPVQVQGGAAAQDIADGIAALNLLKDSRPDVMIVGRGGGSLEDLWAFNEEVVARALFASEIPTISAVGHQTDFTISDFVADHRAATPTEAAVDAVPDAPSLLQQLTEAQLGLKEAVRGILDRLEEDIERAANLLHSLNPAQVLERGYAIVSKKGASVSSVSQLETGDGIEVTLRDGGAQAIVGRVRRSPR